MKEKKNTNMKKKMKRMMTIQKCMTKIWDSWGSFVINPCSSCENSTYYNWPCNRARGWRLSVSMGVSIKTPLKPLGTCRHRSRVLGEDPGRNQCQTTAVENRTRYRTDSAESDLRSYAERAYALKNIEMLVSGTAVRLIGVVFPVWCRLYSF